jgi:hypothetical protein
MFVEIMLRKAKIETLDFCFFLKGHFAGLL